jgi:hypothetical protein
MLKTLRVAKINILFITMTFIFCSAAYPAETEQDKTLKNNGLFTEASIITGYGSGHIPEGNYQPILLIGHFGIDLKRYLSELKDHRGSLSFFLEPQFNTVVNPKTDYECGVGIGLQYRYPLTDIVSIFAMGSVGPHYISVVTAKQANGFIFSDVLGAGFYFYLTKDSAITAGYRFRHISNAHMAEPNFGIDNHFVTIGYSVFFD